MLQKLEHLYLEILRVAVIVLAGLLLVAVIALGVDSFRALQPAAPDKAATPPVAYDTLKNSILGVAPPAGIAAGADPNQPHYDRAAETIATFVTTESGGNEVADKVKIAAITRDFAQKYQDPDVVAAFAQSYADATWTLLKDPAIIASVKGTSPAGLVNRMLDTFVRQFEQRAGAVKAQGKASQEAHNQRQAEGRRNLYLAGGAFAAFLMVVSLAVLIRIERHLRDPEDAED